MGQLTTNFVTRTLYSNIKLVVYLVTFCSMDDINRTLRRLYSCWRK